MTRTTSSCRIWSANCPPAVTNSAAAGAPTTSAPTAPAAKTFHHDVVGDLELSYESVDMISDPGLTLTLYAAEPASPTAHALDLLASGPLPPTARSRRGCSRFNPAGRTPAQHRLPE